MLKGVIVHSHRREFHDNTHPFPTEAPILALKKWHEELCPTTDTMLSGQSKEKKHLSIATK